MKIGVFDSGLGGLVITKAFIQAMPGFDYIYYGDTENLPYGVKTPERILELTIEAVKYLIAQDCKLIIIACNTATSIAIRYIQQRFIPVYAPKIKVLGVIVPTVEEAIESGAQNIGIIATSITVNSHIYRAEINKINSNIHVQEIAAPELVPLIEANDFHQARRLCKKYADKFENIEALILGCTHYPLLKQYFRELMPNVKIISQDEFMGAKLQNYLQRHPEISAMLTRNHQYNFIVSKLNTNSLEVAQRLFAGIKIDKKKLQELNCS